MGAAASEFGCLLLPITQQRYIMSHVVALDSGWPDLSNL